MGLGGRVLGLLLLLGWAIGIKNQPPATNNLDVRHQEGRNVALPRPSIYWPETAHHHQEGRNVASPRPSIYWPEKAHYLFAGGGTCPGRAHGYAPECAEEGHIFRDPSNKLMFILVAVDAPRSADISMPKLAS